jgi:KUP system potassium uptake protein
LDGTYFGTCLIKVFSGGWFPVLTALFIMFLMITWRDGWKILGAKIATKKRRLDLFIEGIFFKKPLRLAGTGVYLSSFRTEVPPMLLYQLNHTNSMHEQVILLSLLTENVPVVEPDKRLDVRRMGQGIYRLSGHYGFMEMPKVPELMAQAKEKGLDIDLDKVKYYLGRISLVPADKPGMSRIRRFLFSFMQRNQISPVVYYEMPPQDVLELGVQVEF